MSRASNCTDMSSCCKKSNNLSFVLGFSLSVFLHGEILKELNPAGKILLTQMNQA